MTHSTVQFGEAEGRAAGQLIELALAEDLADIGDLTSRTLVDETASAEVVVAARRPGVLAGLPVVAVVYSRLDAAVRVRPQLHDGATLHAGSVIATVAGPLRSVLAGERTALNFLTHLSGVATLTRRYVDAVSGTGARILDTRKTLPGYRVLQKYAVRAGGGCNHRMGLFDGILIKDNHLAHWRQRGDAIDAAVRYARQKRPASVPIEVEVDTLEQLQDALDGRPDIVLLDNMPPQTLRKAVAVRDETAPQVELEASGGVTLETVRAIAESGVERISVGGLTHSAAALDIAFDWPEL